MIAFVALPEIIQPFDNVTVNVTKHQSAILECSAIGFPPPQIVWKKYSYYYYRSYSNTYTVQSSSVLAINNSVIYNPYNIAEGGPVFQVTSYLNVYSALKADTYICEASSSIGVARRNIDVIVQGKKIKFNKNMSSRYNYWWSLNL